MAWVFKNITPKGNDELDFIIVKFFFFSEMAF